MLSAHVAFVLFIGVIAAFEPESHKNWKLLPHDKCGVGTVFRILGGKEAPLGAFPWIVRVGTTSNITGKVYFNCGGSLISKKHVLTAAHCVVLDESYTIGPIRLGEHNTETNPDCERGICAKPYVDVDVDKIITPTKSKSIFQNDIALVKLSKSVTFSKSVAPICLGNNIFVKKHFAEETAQVAGWGYTKLNDMRKSKILESLVLPILKESACHDAYAVKKLNITSSHICAGGVDGLDSCNGDSGGPLMIEQNYGKGYKLYLLGIVSFGPTHCGDSRYPGIYTRVSTFSEWILDNLTE